MLVQMLEAELLDEFGVQDVNFTPLLFHFHTLLKLDLRNTGSRSVKIKESISDLVSQRTRIYLQYYLNMKDWVVRRVHYNHLVATPDSTITLVSYQV